MLTHVIAACAIMLAAPAQTKTPLQRTQELIEVFKEVKTAPSGQTLSATDAQANKAVYKRLDDFYDFHTLASAPLAPYKQKLTNEQQAKIQPMFEELLRLVAYPKSSGFLRQANYKLKVGAKAEDVQMDATATEQELNTSVVFHWQNQASVWRIIDVSFDGVSLILDYKNQFGRIIDKEGGEGLVKKLSTRLNKERSKKGA